MSAEAPSALLQEKLDNSISSRTRVICEEADEDGVRLEWLPTVGDEMAERLMLKYELVRIKMARGAKEDESARHGTSINDEEFCGSLEGANKMADPNFEQDDLLAGGTDLGLAASHFEAAIACTSGQDSELTGVCRKGAVNIPCKVSECCKMRSDMSDGQISESGTIVSKVTV